MYFYPVGGGPLLDLIFVLIILGVFVVGVISALHRVKDGIGSKFEKWEREAAKLPYDIDGTIFTKYGTWNDAWFTPFREISESEFNEAVKIHERVIRENFDPSYRYKGPKRLKPSKNDHYLRR